MEYFKLTSQRGNPIPDIVNWYGQMDVRKLNRNDYKELPKFFLLDMKIGTDILYPDILTYPVLMVSRDAMEVIRMYAEDMPFLYVALFAKGIGETASYYCPILEDNKEEAVIYRVKKLDGYEIRIRLDLAESLLSRGAIGLSLTRLQ